jgi:hypothetical protein
MGLEMKYKALLVLFISGNANMANSQTNTNYRISNQIDKLPIPIFYIEKIKIKDTHRKINKVELIRIQKLIKYCYLASLKKNHQGYLIRKNGDLMRLLYFNFPKMNQIPSEFGMVMVEEVSRFLDRIAP